MRPLKYNIHLAINLRSHRKGLVNDKSLQFIFKEMQFRYGQGTADEFNSRDISPANTYGTFYPNVYGKVHSSYKLRF